MIPDQTPTDPAPPETVDLSRGLRLAAIALVSAAVTATLVITIGSALLQRSAPVGGVTHDDATSLSAG